MRIRLFDAAERRLERLTDVGRDLPHIPPMAARGKLEAVVFGKQRGFLIPTELHQGGRMFFILNIRDALEEQERENVGLEIGGIDRPAKDVRGLPKVRFELGEGHGKSCIRLVGTPVTKRKSLHSTI